MTFIKWSLISGRWKARSSVYLSQPGDSLIGVLGICQYCTDRFQRVETTICSGLIALFRLWEIVNTGCKALCRVLGMDTNRKEGSCSQGAYVLMGEIAHGGDFRCKPDEQVPQSLGENSRGDDCASSVTSFSLIK